MDLARLRVGICRTPAWDNAHPDARAAVEDCARLLEQAGARLSDFNHELVFGGLAEANRTVSGYEFARSLARNATAFATSRVVAMRP